MAEGLASLPRDGRKVLINTGRFQSGHFGSQKSWKDGKSQISSPADSR